MLNTKAILTERKSLHEICRTPEKIISVYSLEKHVWADGASSSAMRARRPELRTVEEFQIDPARPFLNDIFANIAAYDQDGGSDAGGQGYWIQAEFGAGKSHLLCFVGALALGDQSAWQLIAEKEQRAGRKESESLYRYWQQGIASKNSAGKKGILAVVKTLVGSGGGAIGLTDKGRSLTEYILDAVKTQLQIETGKNISLYPAELLADRFLHQDLARYQRDLKKYLRDARFFSKNEFDDASNFIRDIEQPASDDTKRKRGHQLWRFYTEYLKVQPQIATDNEEILKHMVEQVRAEGYCGLLLVLDELSLFMRNRDEEQRHQDEKTLVVLANRLAKVHHLPIWTVCAAQQAIESQMGINNIIANDRLKLIKLLEDDRSYYNIALNRVREIVDLAATSSYYQHYQRNFSWPASIGADEFARFFPFHKPALEILRAITYQLTSTRSAIYFMHQALKAEMKREAKELIRLSQLFDESEPQPDDDIHAGLTVIKAQREAEYQAYQTCRRQLDGITKGFLKVHRHKAAQTITSLFLAHIAKSHPIGLAPEDIANLVLMERAPDSDIKDNHEHYEILAENLKKELRQIAQCYDESNHSRYRFEPIFTGIDPRDEFQKARLAAEGNAALQRAAWQHLLGLDEWRAHFRQMTMDLSHGITSIFRNFANARVGEGEIEINWQGRQISGLVAMLDLARLADEKLSPPTIESERTDRDFAIIISTGPASFEQVAQLIACAQDPRILFWTPAQLRAEERERLIDFAAYRKLLADWQDKDSEDAATIFHWLANALQADLGKIYKIVPDSYARGRIDALNHSQMEYCVAGELAGIITPLIDRALGAIYQSPAIKFAPPLIFRKEDGVKVINGIVKTGEIAKGAKPNQHISAAQNFGYGLGIIKKSDERKLDTANNIFVNEIWNFIDEKLADEDQSMKLATIYKNFIGMGASKCYGLSRRMIQIYLLCLTRAGRLRIALSAKSGLPFNQIDRDNIAEIDFTAGVLAAMTELRKVKIAATNDALLLDISAGIQARLNRQGKKRVVVEKVRLANFKPSFDIIDKAEIPSLVKEFEAYLRAQIDGLDDDDDTLPLLQIE